MTVSADRRGWGPGWPHNNAAKCVTIRGEISGVTLLVRKEIAPILKFCIDECERRGYLFDLGPKDPTDDWGFANRSIAGTSIASNHSWGLAADLDASKYPQGQTKRHLPQWVIDVFNKYRFDNGVYWHNPDPMHEEFNGTPPDAAFLVASLAGHHIDGTPPPMPPSAPPVIHAPVPPPTVQEDDMRLIRNAITGAVVALYADGTHRAVTGEAFPVLTAQVGPAHDISLQREWDLTLSYYPTDRGAGGGN